MSELDFLNVLKSIEKKNDKSQLRDLYSMQKD